MKNLFQSLAFLSVVLMAGTSSAGLFKTREDIRKEEEAKKSQEVVQRTQADAVTKIADIEADMRALNGRVEVAEARSNQYATAIAQTRQGVEIITNEQSKKILILQDEVEKLTAQVAQLTAEMNAIKAAGAQELAADKAEKAAPPKDAFQLAEDSFEKKDWKRAIFNYNKFRDANPKNKKFVEATYKIGVSFQELGMKDEARTFYDEVTSKFPNSAEAKKAKTRLKSLKR